MLVLSRKINEEIVIGDNIKVTVLKLKGNTVRIGIEAPRDVRIVRAELPPQSRETPSANVNVVFGDTMDRSRDMSTRDILDSRSSEASANILPFQSSASDPTCSISYRERLPKMLEHNRLRQIVSELSQKK